MGKTIYAVCLLFSSYNVLSEEIFYPASNDIDNTNRRNYHRNVNLMPIKGSKLCHTNDLNNCCLIDFNNYGNVRIHVS